MTARTMGAAGESVTWAVAFQSKSARPLAEVNETSILPFGVCRSVHSCTRRMAMFAIGVSKRGTFGLTYHFSCRLLGSECAQQALDFQRSEWTGFLAVSVRVKRMYA